MVGSNPCLEGLLLSILGARPAVQSAECKKSIQQLLNIDLTERKSYVRDFPKAVLELARTKIEELDRLLEFIQG